MERNILFFVFISCWLIAINANANEDVKETRPALKDDYLAQEDTRMREIRLLSLDLERADLRSKLNKLNQESGDTLKASPSKDKDMIKPSLVIKGIITLGQKKRAMIAVNNKNITADAGDKLESGETILNIEKTTVLIKDAMGQEHLLGLGG